MPKQLFITNDTKQKTLHKRLQVLIEASQELKFLVGFFYFSGLNCIYKSLRESPESVLKILVGLEVDRHLGGLIEVALAKDSLSDGEISERFIHSLSHAINADHSDGREVCEQIRFFTEQLAKGRLVIRKTLRPNHAKLYLFNLKDHINSVCDCRFITGSSNLTSPGLFNQDEFNIEISDYGTGEAEAYFDELWDEAVEISEHDETKRRILTVLREESLVAEINPFEAYALVLKTYFDLQRQHEVPKSVEDLLEDCGYQNYKYQVEAVQQALTIIDTYNGVIIADVVGLGKSVIAGMVAASLQKSGMIICPPGLMGAATPPSGWEMYKRQFNLHNWDVCSSGDLAKALEYTKYHDPQVVIVDEVHRFRNQDTRDYELLSQICMNRTVVLLTATPFNNSPEDIFSLLKLFIVPGRSPLTLSNDLAGRFREYQGVFRRLNYIKKNHDSTDEDKRRRAENFYLALFGDLPVEMPNVLHRAHVLARSIRSVIEPVVIRRNRIDLLSDPVYSKEIDTLSTVEPPEEQFFYLTEEQSAFYDEVIGKYFGDEGLFKGAIYRPFEYEEGKRNNLSGRENFELQSQRNLFEFMRRLLVKRFESSFGSFEQSIKNFKRVSLKVQKFINKTGKYILDRSLLEKIYTKSLSEIETELDEFTKRLDEKDHPKSHKVYVLEEFADKDGFLADLQADIDLFSRIEKDLKMLDLVKNDPKLEQLIICIRKVLQSRPASREPRRKVIIFSEYVDTVKYLTPLLEEAFSGKVLDVPGSMGKQKSEALLANFDASVPSDRQEDQYDILLASDSVSEGFNLNRAGLIINYDIPWNPTRVLQRIGRINRIGKKVFDRLYIYNFFPTVQGSNVVRSRQIASDKMFLIHNTLGEDLQVFDKDDEIPEASALYKRVMASPDAGEEETLHTTLRKSYIEICEKHPDVIRKISRFAPRVKTAKSSGESSLTVFTRKGLGLFAQGVSGTSSEVHELTLEDAVKRVSCTVDEPRLDLSETFWDRYETIRDYRASYKRGGQKNSIEDQALINLKAILKGRNAREFGDDITFIRVLLEDLLDYKTLSEYTLRRIAGISIPEKGDADLSKARTEIRKIKGNLGGDYLQKLKERIGEMNQEVIIAVENISHPSDGASS